MDLLHRRFAHEYLLDRDRVASAIRAAGKKSAARIASTLLAETGMEARIDRALAEVGAPSPDLGSSFGRHVRAVLPTGNSEAVDQLRSALEASVGRFRIRDAVYRRRRPVWRSLDQMVKPSRKLLESARNGWLTSDPDTAPHVAELSAVLTAFVEFANEQLREPPPIDLPPVMSAMATLIGIDLAEIAQDLFGIEDTFGYPGGEAGGAIVDFAEACLAEIGLQATRNTIGSYIGRGRDFRSPLKAGWFVQRPFG